MFRADLHLYTTQPLSLKVAPRDELLQEPTAYNEPALSHKGLPQTMSPSFIEREAFALPVYESANEPSQVETSITTTQPEKKEDNIPKLPQAVIGLESLGQHVRHDLFHKLNKNYLERTVQLPDDPTLDTYLNSNDAGWIGAKYGAIFGLFIAPALAWYCHKAKKPSLTLSMLSGISHTKVMEQVVPCFSRGVEALQVPNKRNALINAGMTMLESLQLVGGIGYAIATVQTNELKHRVHAIRHAQEQNDSRVYDWPQEGVQLGPVSLGIHRGHDSKPTPTEAIGRLRNDQLDRQNAFWFGVQEALLVKVSLLGGTLGLAYVAAKVQEAITKNTKLTTDMTHFITHPIFIAKMLVTPIIGGLVSLELVKYLNHQLRLSVQASSPALVLPMGATDTKGTMATSQGEQGYQYQWEHLWLGPSDSVSPSAQPSGTKPSKPL